VFDYVGNKTTGNPNTRKYITLIVSIDKFWNFLSLW